jgi:hypothetical protein
MVIDPTHVPHVFKFIAAKRGPQVGWVDEDFKKQIIRHFCHAEDGIYWRAATEDDLMAAQEAAAAKSGPANKKATLTVEWELPIPAEVALAIQALRHLRLEGCPFLLLHVNARRGSRWPIRGYFHTPSEQ